MRKSKMVSMRYTKKMLDRLDKTAYLLGMTKRKVVDLGIDLAYKQALKEEKKA